MAFPEDDLVQLSQVDAQPAGTIIIPDDDEARAPWCWLVHPADCPRTLKFIQADVLEQWDGDPARDTVRKAYQVSVR